MDMMTTAYLQKMAGSNILGLATKAYDVNSPVITDNPHYYPASMEAAMKIACCAEAIILTGTPAIDDEKLHTLFSQEDFSDPKHSWFITVEALIQRLLLHSYIRTSCGIMAGPNGDHSLLFASTRIKQEAQTARNNILHAVKIMGEVDVESPDWYKYRYADLCDAVIPSAIRGVCKACGIFLDECNAKSKKLFEAGAGDGPQVDIAFIIVDTVNYLQKLGVSSDPNEMKPISGEIWCDPAYFMEERTAYFNWHDPFGKKVRQIEIKF